MREFLKIEGLRQHPSEDPTFFFNELLTGIFSASLKLKYVDSGLNILSKMEIILYTRCYRSDPEPDPVRKVPDPAGQKSAHQDPHHYVAYLPTSFKRLKNIPNIVRLFLQLTES